MVGWAEQSPHCGCPQRRPCGFTRVWLTRGPHVNAISSGSMKGLSRGGQHTSSGSVEGTGKFFPCHSPGKCLLSLCFPTTCFPSRLVSGKRSSWCAGSASLEPWARCYPVLPHAGPPCMHCPVQPGTAWLPIASAGLWEHPPSSQNCVPTVCQSCWDPPSSLAHILSVPFPPPVDQSMFENASASAAPTPRAQHVPAAAGSVPQPCRPAGTQHLRNLGKAVGARVNDLLRRREPAGLPGVGAMEVNASAGAVLGAGQPAAEDGAAGLEAFPRLEPPPPITKKRTPRALKTPQDMLIAPQMEGTGTRSGTDEPPEPPTAHPDPAEEQLGMGDPSPPECPGVPSVTGTLEPSGDQPTSALPVPDLIHKGSQESQWQVGDRATEMSPSMEKSSRRPELEHEPPGSTGRPELCSPGWEVEGAHPDLLSFE
ncbi:uncharacterized protein C1orf226 homolog [Acridotheres tristis]